MLKKGYHWIIFYFSGTGNAAFAADKIAKNLSKAGIQVKVVNIAEHQERPSIQLIENVNIGFCYPTHGFNAPPIIIKYLTRFPKGDKNNVFLLNTRAGMKFYKWFTPGLSGLGLFLPAIILRFKNYRIKAYRPLDMPSNWISLHPGLKEKVIHSIIERCKQTISGFSKKIASGQRVHRGLIDLPLDLLVTPIAIVYFFYGRLALAKTFFADFNCNNCGLCIRECPVKAVKKLMNRPYWTYHCESCMKCMNHCPKAAIQTAHGFTFLIWWFLFSLGPLLFFKMLYHVPIALPEWLGQIMYYVLALLLVFALYFLMTFLLRFRFFNVLLTYSSFTRFRFWRRYPPGKQQVI